MVTVRPGSRFPSGGAVERRALLERNQKNTRFEKVFTAEIPNKLKFYIARGGEGEGGGGGLAGVWEDADGPVVQT